MSNPKKSKLWRSQRQKLKMNILIQKFILYMKCIATIRTLGFSLFLLNLLHWIFINSLKNFIFNDFGFFSFTICFSLDLVLFLPWIMRVLSFPLEYLRETIWINLSFSFVSESNKVHKEGIFQLETTSLVAWKVDTKNEYSRLNLEKTERINWSSFFSIFEN